METAKHPFTSVMGGISIGKTSDPYITRGRVESLNAAFSLAPISLKSVFVIDTTPYCSATSLFQIGPSNTPSLVCTYLYNLLCNKNGLCYYIDAQFLC